MKVELTQQEIDLLYFDLRDYVKTIANVDRLSQMTEEDKIMLQPELNLINKFSKL